jgi:hypothetical protein
MTSPAFRRSGETLGSLENKEPADETTSVGD